MDTALTARGLTKTYAGDGIDVLALRGVDLDVTVGDLVAVMGPSGCGKSTLLHLLGGLDRPTAGSIAIGGTRVEALGEAAWAVLRRREIGFVFQFFNLVQTLTVAENVELPALLVGTSRIEARRRRDELLDRLEVSGPGRRAAVAPVRRAAAARRAGASARQPAPPPSRGRADRQSRQHERPRGRRGSASGL